MSFDFTTLEPHIYHILSAPGTDLSTISAKRVRKQLLHLEPSLTSEFLKENKEEVDAVIGSVFKQVSAGQFDGVAPPEDAENSTPEFSSKKRKQKEEEEYDGESKPPLHKRTKSAKTDRELSDAELARKLSSEINGSSRRSNGRGKGPSAKKSRAKKSATTVASDESDEEGGKKSKTKRKSSGEGGAKGGFAKEYVLSEPLAVVLNVEKLSRPQVVKQLWVYIKGNGLQNPNNKREIMCDARFKAVFNCDKIDMFKMNKVLGQHLHEE